MLLTEMSLEERKEKLRAWPILVSSFANGGKSTAVEFLPDDEKKRTIIFLAENKRLPEDLESQYRTVYRLKPLDYVGEGCKDSGNIKYKTVEEFLPLIKKAIAHKDVDRVIIDSFTAYISELERTYVKLHNGFQIWTTYVQHLHDLFMVLKEETFAHAKLVYLYGHYLPSKDKKDSDAEKFTLVKGKEFFRMIESQFNTVVTIEDFKFVADNSNQFDSTRIKRSLSPYESKENSLAELEEALSK